MKTLLSHTALAALALGLSIRAASADWEYTRWGMTPEEVVKASNGEVAPQAPGDRMLPVVLASGTYTRRGVTWRASFEFTPDNRLQAVSLTQDNGLVCDAAMDSTTMDYGPYRLDTPLGSGIASRAWTNGKAGDRGAPGKPDSVEMVTRVMRGLTGPYVTCEFRHKPDWEVLDRLRKQADAR